MDSISNIISYQKAFFNSQKTKSVATRLIYLKALKNEIISKEQAIYDALNKDFKKPEFETFLSEFGLVMSQLNLVIKNLKKWSKPKQMKSSILTFPSKDYIYKEPYGNVLVIAPWNYPFLLALEPVIMAIAAGNTVILKPSELTKHTSQLITDILTTVFPEAYAKSIQGDANVATELLAQKWDYIFFTGSVSVGKIIALAAAKHLTPVTLELGGKSPCIIDDTVNLKLAATRIAWGKFLNGGQTCIAPDYIIVKHNVKQELIVFLKDEITRFYGENPKESVDFPRIINTKNTLRIAHMLKDANIIFGGTIDETNNYIAPTIVDEPTLESDLMRNEIFGPILPILTYDTQEDIDRIITSFEKPLALYTFSNNKIFVEHILNTYSFGGGVVNDVLIHFGNHRLPFGGVGASGMGVYHGKHGFDTFLHSKAIIKRGNWMDPPLRYAPYSGKLNLIKKLFKLFS
ncbi:Aldehyde dehydrogenase [Mariniflexile rhizosphaerae]|uniref:aldehyde dehydrogenase n=1 Tax=unclassified Mariniflexile TaxID=2643887 RepID=UPI000CB6FD93|nr:Aldehyde dehydrogenase [Mariniflexile sp. TRM1-10]PLB18890.1 MAG: Aldehyde dehydrogenase [Flavobacteriaceae bacterium FS1-H7996/R]